MVSERDLGRHHGAGTLGADAAEVLRPDRLSRRRLEPQPEADRRHRLLFRRPDRSTPFCNGPILVCLLPLTPKTRHILNREVFAKLQPHEPGWGRRS